MDFNLRRDVIAATLSAARLLNARPSNPQAAWELVSPYLHLDDISGASAHRRNITLCMLFCIAADCQRELDHFEESAALYQRASRYPGFYGHAGSFARLVLDHELDEYFDSAVHTVRQQRAWWASRSRVYKITTYGLWWVRYGLWRPDIRAMYRELKDYEELLLSEAIDRGL